MLRMRVPKHFVRGIGSTVNVIDDNDWTGKRPYERMIYCPDYNNDPLADFFFDTDRGLDDINDCVHSKVVGSIGLPNAPFANVVLSNGDFGLPQGNWDSSKGLIRYNHMHTGWWHQFEFIHGLSVYRPVLVGFSWSFRVSSIGGWPPEGYTYWGIDCRVFYYCTAVIPDTQQSWTAPAYYGGAYFTCKPNFPLEVSQPVGHESTFFLPKGYYVPGTLLPSRAKTKQEAISNMTAALDAACRSAVSYLRFNTAGKSKATCEVVQETETPSIGRENFIFNEDLMIMDRLPDQVVRNPNVYWRNWLVQHAYLEALQSVPTLNDNSISNIIEIVGFIKALVVDHRIEIPKRLQDAWLSYRYSYTTTKLDFQEAISFMKRHVNLGSLDRELKCYGTSSTTVNDVAVTCRCTLSIKPTDLGYVGKIWRALDTYGLKPDFYVIWDMIPYSFIVDWFIPVGDLLSVVDANSRFSGTNYTISNVCFSLSYQRKIGHYCYKQYSRWKADPLMTFNEFYWFDKPKTSSKVKMYRLFDTASLFIGR